MSSAYALLKTVHVVSATILFGTGLGTAFFCWFGWWFALGVPAFTAVVALFYLIVAKPLPVA